METIEKIRQMFIYNDWANHHALEALRAMDSPSVRASRVFGHLLIAEKTWLKRILYDQDTTGFNFWQEMSLSQYEMLVNENRETCAAFLSDCTEEKLDAKATYKNSKGIEYRTTYRDVLTHVLFHSAYHRGQVAIMMREDGGEPAYTDYIVFLREKERQAT